MPKGREKSGRFRKIATRTPKGKVITRYEKRLPKVAHCATCGKVLHGIPRMSTVQATTSPKTVKRPERPWGGKLCSPCMRQQLKTLLA